MWTQPRSIISHISFNWPSIKYDEYLLCPVDKESLHIYFPLDILICKYTCQNTTYVPVRKLLKRGFATRGCLLFILYDNNSGGLFQKFIENFFNSLLFLESLYTTKKRNFSIFIPEHCACSMRSCNWNPLIEKLMNIPPRDPKNKIILVQNQMYKGTACINTKITFCFSGIGIHNN